MEPAGSGKHLVQFTGDGGTYFGIWIVNLLLTVVTLGIYSPWAKVRRLRYFYGNTLVDGSPFEFHGSPIAILKGRLIALVLVIAYSQSAKISIALWLGVVTAIGLALPWLLWKSLRFRLGNSSYRGIRFAFDGTLAQSYLCFLPFLLLFIGPAAAGGFLAAAAKAGGKPPALFVAIVPVVLLGALCLAPWLYIRLKRFQHASARLGSTPFSFSGTSGGGYLLALKCVGIWFLASFGALAVGATVGLVASLIVPHAAGATPGQPNYAAMAAGIGAGYFALFCAYPFIIALTQNFVWGHTALDGQPIESRLDGFTLTGISIVNALLFVVTMGLYWPYAVIRTLRCRLQALAWMGDPAAIVAHAAEAPVGATGEEAADMLGFDLAL